MNDHDGLDAWRAMPGVEHLMLTPTADDDWCMLRRRLPDGRLIIVYAQLYHVLLTIGPAPVGDLAGWDEGWEYESPWIGLLAALTWQPEVEPAPWLGWSRHIGRNGHIERST